MNCRLCGSSEKNLDTFDTGILVCSSCHGIFRIQIDEPDHHFQKFDPKIVDKLKNKKGDKKFWKLISDEYIKYLKSKTNMNFNHVLDVGTLYGSFVKSLNDLGIDAEGIESNENFFKLKVSNKIIHEFFDINYKSQKKYNLIALTQMIYYLPDSFAILKKCHEMLNDNGLVFISTINPESSLIQNKLTPNFNPGVNIYLSKLNYTRLENFELLDYTSYNADLFNEMYKHNKIKMIKFMVGLKKPYSINPDGNHAFLLLKKI